MHTEGTEDGAAACTKHSKTAQRRVPRVSSMYDTETHTQPRVRQKRHKRSHMYDKRHPRSRMYDTELQARPHVQQVHLTLWLRLPFWFSPRVRSPPLLLHPRVPLQVRPRLLRVPLRPRPGLVHPDPDVHVCCRLGVTSP